VKRLPGENFHRRVSLMLCNKKDAIYEAIPGNDKDVFA
jgi:hypothetical protein